MRAKKCGMSEKEKHFRRLNYCGTCKTIGSLYGQKSRLLLNHDTVFLAEILSALSGENVKDWQKSLQSFNCFNLPTNEMPKSLQFAATTNVILTEFKLADHIADENKKRYQFAQKAFSKEFQKAAKNLEDWNFPLDDVKAILQTQTTRETENSIENIDERLTNYAEPTAQTTAIFFREGVRQIGRSDLADSAFALGYSFGKLIYLLDAFEDYEKDFRHKQFNAISAAFDLKESRLSSEIKRQSVSILRELEFDITNKIRELPIDETQTNLFIARLSDNLERKLKTNLPIVKTAKVCAPKTKQTFRQRWQMASAKAKSLAQNYSWQMPLVFLFIFVFALVAPAQSREAKSARECFDLGFNLMFIGSIVGAVFAIPKHVLTQDILAEEEKRKRRESWCDSCDCCDCCNCDGCCDCCVCDSCDCCSCDGCCDSCDCSCD